MNQIDETIVLSWFEKLCAIPHGSGNTAGISQFCVDFATERGLAVCRDEAGNVIIRKDATNDSKEPVILQAHLDMVCEKLPDKEFDFTKDSLVLLREGDMLTADGTTLGADNGIAVAMILTILDAKDIVHPPIEAVFTVDEEIGMLGADALDCSVLSGKRLLNLDSDEEGTLIAGCAGGIRVDCKKKIGQVPCDGILTTITAEGMLGGHSGVEIHKERANANCVLIRFLNQLKLPFSIVSLCGGERDNVIASNATAEILIHPDFTEELSKEVTRFSELLKSEYAVSDPDICLRVVFGNQSSKKVFAETKQMLAFLNALPGGVQNRNVALEMVETSLNMGVLSCKDGELHAGFAVRSAIASRLDMVCEKIKSLCTLAGIEYSSTGRYPAWEYRKDSFLRDTCVKAYQRVYGEEPKVETIHAGLECGLFYERIPGLDAISFGPALYDIHSPQERVSISSVGRTWNLLLKILEDL